MEPPLSWKCTNLSLTVLILALMGPFLLTECSNSVAPFPANSSSSPPVSTFSTNATETPGIRSNSPNASTPVGAVFIEGQHSPLDIKPTEKSQNQTEPSAVTAGPSVHARKGVSLEDIKKTESKPENNTVTNPVGDSTKLDKVTIANGAETKVDKPANATLTPPSSTTPKFVPKKPLITTGTDETEVIVPIPVPKPSTPDTKTNVAIEKVEKTAGNVKNVETPVAEFVKSPDVPNAKQNAEGSTFTSYFSNIPGNQPGFVIPLIITIFAVPFLALIGYQAVSRGKEAWRNRHYRRMDYLIEGMYND